MTHFVLRADAGNPAQFLGACGFLELAGVLKPGVRSRWVPEGLHIDADESLFTAVLDLLGRLKWLPDSDWTGDIKNRPFTLHDPQSSWSLPMHWWETAEGGKAQWKCIAGQMKMLDTSKNLCIEALKNAVDARPESLLQLSHPLSFRLNFDPRSSWDTLRAGFSPNELKIKVATFAFAECMSSIALQTFAVSARKGREGAYRIWLQTLPLALARVAVAAEGGIPVECVSYVFAIKARGQGSFYFSDSKEISNHV